MSTKIYNAYRTHAGVEQILSGLHRLRGKVQTAWYDRCACLMQSLPPDSKGDVAFACGLARGIMSGEDGLNPTCSAVLYGFPSPKAGEPKHLVQFFGFPYRGDEADALKKLLRSWGAREYEYQNQTDDLPDGVSYKDYVARGRKWDRILPTGVPSVHGFSFDIVSNQAAIMDLFTILEKNNPPQFETTDPERQARWRPQDIALFMTDDFRRAFNKHDKAALAAFEDEHRERYLKRKTNPTP